jgi:hypothetical protein
LQARHHLLQKGKKKNRNPNPKSKQKRSIAADRIEIQTMRFSPVLVAVSFIITVTAQNFSSYVPDCAPPCVQQTLNSTKICASLEDNKCLCTNFPQIVFPSIQCFVQTCNTTNMVELRCMYKMCSLSSTTSFSRLKNDSQRSVSFIAERRGISEMSQTDMVS